MTFQPRQILTAQMMNIIEEAIAALQSLGALSFQGSWNAATNTPALASGVGVKGHYYTVSVAGTTEIDGNATWEVGDKITFNGTVWERTESGDLVSSVAGLTGLVTASALKTALGFVLADIVAALGFTPVNRAGDTMTGPLTLSGSPSTAFHAATKQYVDNLVQGLKPKTSCQLATTANIALAGEQTIDGIVTNGSRVLVKNQTAPAQNGIYVSNAGAWTRAPDADAWTELVSAFCFIEQGVVNADSGWVCTSDAGGVLGTAAVTFIKFSTLGNPLLAANNLSDVANAALAFAAIKQLATAEASGVVEKATPAEVRAGVADKYIDGQLIESASAEVALTDAATVVWDWNAGINFSLAMNNLGTHTIGNPANGKPGTWRTIRLYRTSGGVTGQTIAFGNQFGGELPTITDANDTKWYLLMIYCITASHFSVSAKRILG